MTRGESPEFVNRPCHQCAVLRKHCQWSRGQLYFTLWKHFPGVLCKQCAYPAYCGEMWLFVIQNFSTQGFKLKISGFFIGSWVFLLKTSCRPNILLCTVDIPWNQAIMYSYRIHWSSLKCLNTGFFFQIDLYF